MQEQAKLPNLIENQQKKLPEQNQIINRKYQKGLKYSYQGFSLVEKQKFIDKELVRVQYEISQLQNKKSENNQARHQTQNNKQIIKIKEENNQNEMKLNKSSGNLIKQQFQDQIKKSFHLQNEFKKLEQKQNQNNQIIPKENLIIFQKLQQEKKSKQSIYIPIKLDQNKLLQKSPKEQINNNRVQNYKLGEIIGIGSYAIVKMGIHMDTNEKVAIKIYDKFKLMDNMKKQNLEREIKILKIINHPNIVKLIKTINTQQSINLIMEYVSDLSLYQYIKQNKKISQNQAKLYFLQILDAINYLHNQNIYHRDIKLQNILIDKSNSIKIIDFGFSIISKEKLKTVCGTLSYMAPEIIEQKEYLGQNVDLWACGVVFYVLLCGSFPFKGIDDKSLLKQIHQQNINFDSLVLNQEGQDFFMKIFKLNPNQRLNIQQIKMHPFINQM